MSETDRMSWDTRAEDALSLWLHEAVQSGRYTEEYCTKLEDYAKVTKN